MHERIERKKRTCIGEERSINDIGFFISNNIKKLSSVIILKKRLQKNSKTRNLHILKHPKKSWILSFMWLEIQGVLS
jgi:hypothetical protein